MRFNPLAQLSPGQVTDLSHNSNFLYFLHNARQSAPLEASALRMRDYLVYWLLHNHKALALHPRRPMRRVG